MSGMNFRFYPSTSCRKLPKAAMLKGSTPFLFLCKFHLLLLRVITQAWHKWLMPVIRATQEVQIRRINSSKLAQENSS
jgi:hypothetical protein